MLFEVPHPLSHPYPSSLLPPCLSFLPLCSLDLLLFFELWKWDLASGHLQMLLLSAWIALSPGSTCPHTLFSLLQVLTQM